MYEEKAKTQRRKAREILIPYHGCLHCRHSHFNHRNNCACTKNDGSKHSRNGCIWHNNTRTFCICNNNHIQKEHRKRTQPPSVRKEPKGIKRNWMAITFNSNEISNSNPILHEIAQKNSTYRWVFIIISHNF